MKTPLQSANPFPHSRSGYCWEKVPPAALVLDYGCNDGKVLARLRHDGQALRVGVDLSKDAIEAGRRRYPQLDLRCVAKGEPLPFPDGTFDMVMLLDVLEHVADQTGLLAELRRVTKPGGRLVVTVPGRHVFSFLDMGNYKFYFPRLHRWFITWRHGREHYEYRYGSKNPFGLCGDVEAAKGIHEHFSRKSLGRLLSSAGLDVEEFDGAGLFHRPLIALSRIPLLGRATKKLMAGDARRFNRAHLFATARRPG